ncbi:D-alanyl-D-alanine carboxypeptidase family protein [Stappia sp. 28M-7]|uniref:D-alanyl-D-alanine carboxypeptidase family protein n=1 Tax=Stappia sp. 28M-7 TaxID=2762596 RepID=UPI00163C638D|nr:D-alanyl-D-alanine carboxypeptidase family protein [Stappia sp. 28M-7]MBC2861403.1 D-alanyl-D-alanine carboxypeptidase [Stappia sp. 28M-7]
MRRHSDVLDFTGRHLGRRLRGLAVAASLAVAGLLQAGDTARADVAAWIVIDAETGAVLDHRDALRQWYPASITKLMTAYLAFKAVREGRATLESAVAISANAHAQPPSKMGFKPGTQLTLDSALKMLIVKSANDIAVAVGESLAGSEPAFIEMMNAEARRLGMTATRFVNPHGLPDNRQVSSARDLAVLARALWREFPQYHDYYGLPAIKVGKKTLRSANREFLARVPGASGMKTGYICNSGLNVVVSATRRGRTVLAVVLGAASGVERAAKARVLVEAGFRQRSGRNIDTMTGIAGGPPADGYCKRNTKPTAEELLATYGTGGLRGTTALSYAQLDPATNGVRRPIVGQAPQQVVSADDDDVPTRDDGKTDWGKVMDEIIGPRSRVDQAVQVGLGVPKGRAPASEAKIATLADVPMPKEKPVAVMGTGSPALLPAATTQVPTGEAKPGAIFRGQPLVILPRPSPNPRP